MVRLIALLLITSSLFFAENAMANDSYKAYFSSPVCRDYPHITPVIENDGDLRTSKFGNVYCTDSDFANYKPKENTIEGKIKALLTDPSMKIEHIDLVYYLFKNKAVAEMICDRTKKDNFTVRVISQNSKNSTFISPSVNAKLRSCLKNNLQVEMIGCDVFSQKDCSGKTINTNHFKLFNLRADKKGEKKVYLIVGSGNMIEKIRMNYDDFLTIETSEKNPLYRSHRCIADVMIKANKANATRKTAEESYATCVKNLDFRNAAITPFFMPFDFYRYKANILLALKNAVAVDMAVQDFSDNEIRDALIAAQKRGALVRHITNDRWYYVAQAKKDVGIYKYKKFNSQYAPMYVAGINFRFLETNADLDIAQNNFMHLRYMIVHEPQKSTLFTGASHLKKGALQSNYENQYMIMDSGIIDQYSANFADLWKRGLAWKDMPRVRQLTKYAAEKLANKTDLKKEMGEAQ